MQAAASVTIIVIHRWAQRLYIIVVQKHVQLQQLNRPILQVFYADNYETRYACSPETRYGIPTVSILHHSNKVRTAEAVDVAIAEYLLPPILLFTSTPVLVKCLVQVK